MYLYDILCPSLVRIISTRSYMKYIVPAERSHDSVGVFRLRFDVLNTVIGVWSLIPLAKFFLFSLRGLFKPVIVCRHTTPNLNQ